MPEREALNVKQLKAGKKTGDWEVTGMESTFRHVLLVGTGADKASDTAEQALAAHRGEQVVSALLLALSAARADISVQLVPASVGTTR